MAGFPECGAGGCQSVHDAYTCERGSKCLDCEDKQIDLPCNHHKGTMSTIAKPFIMLS